MIDWCGALPDRERSYVICLGFFDGVHLGHRKLIEEARSIKDSRGWGICVHTYDIPPQKAVHPTCHYRELTPLDEKVPLLLSAGADLVGVSCFNEHLMHMSGEDFIIHALLGDLSVKHIVVGFDHRFGYRADTDTGKLAEICKRQDIGLTIVPPVKTPGGVFVSSSAIKNAIITGDMALAQDMLGRAPNAHMIARIRKSNHF